MRLAATYREGLLPPLFSLALYRRTRGHTDAPPRSPPFAIIRYPGVSRSVHPYIRERRVPIFPALPHSPSPRPPLCSYGLSAHVRSPSKPFATGAAPACAHSNPNILSSGSARIPNLRTERPFLYLHPRTFRPAAGLLSVRPPRYACRRARSARILRHRISFRVSAPAFSPIRDHFVNASESARSAPRVHPLAPSHPPRCHLNLPRRTPFVYCTVGTSWLTVPARSAISCIIPRAGLPAGWHTLRL